MNPLIESMGKKATWGTALATAVVMTVDLTGHLPAMEDAKFALFVGSWGAVVTGILHVPVIARWLGLALADPPSLPVADPDPAP